MAEAVAPLRKDNADLRKEVDLLKAQLDENKLPGHGDLASNIRYLADENDKLRRQMLHCSETLDKIAANGAAQIKLSVLDEVSPTLKEISDRLASFQQQLADLPAPKDGIDGKDAEINWEGVRGVVAALVDEHFQKYPVKDGAPGKDAEFPWDEMNEQLTGGMAMLLEQLDKKIAALPKPADGKDGADGSVDIELLADLVKEAVAELPPPKDGAQGEQGIPGVSVKGEPGEPGRDGRDGPTLDEVVGALGPRLPTVEAVAALVLKSIQLPKDGAPGRDGNDGRDAEIDYDRIVADVLAGVPAPRDGKDGVGIGGTVIDRSGHLIITKTDGSMYDAGVVIGRDGKDGAPGAPGKDGAEGAPGRDGFGFDDMEQTEEPLRFGFAFRRGKEIREFWYTKPTLADFDHEVWKEGNAYPRGAVVTLGGSLWICKVDMTKVRPDLASGKDWRQAVKCGRNGKDGERGPQGPAGPKGADGRMVGFDGKPL